jgi:sugar phosphate permease
VITPTGTKLRWRIALVLSVAIGISYLDRQALSVAIKAVQQDIPLSNTELIAFVVILLTTPDVHSLEDARGRTRATA